MNLICIPPNSIVLIKITLWNVHFEHQISIGKIFPFSKMGSGRHNQASCQKKPSKFVNVSPVYLPSENKFIDIQMIISNNVKTNVPAKSGNKQ